MHEFIFIYETKHLNFFAFTVEMVLFYQCRESSPQAITPPDHLDNMEVTFSHLLQVCSWTWCSISSETKIFFEDGCKLLFWFSQTKKFGQ